MQEQHRFSPDILTLLEQTEEVEIGPASTDGEATRPVTIWVVVDSQDVYVRSVRGPRGRWYQQLLKARRGKLHVGERAIAVRAVHVDDPRVITRVSDAFRRKYESKWPRETAPMLRDEVLPTTLRLELDTT